MLNGSHTLNHHCSPRTQRGLTLIEIMVAVGVAIIVIAIAAPNVVDITRANKLSTSVNDFVQAFHLARSEALKAGGATFCSSSDQASCDDADWTKGWIIFSDFDSDGVLDAGEAIIRVGGGLPSTLVITADTKRVRYGSNGFLTPAGASWTFNFCGGRKGTGAGRTIALNRSGRPETTAYDSCT
jgi:type IV fimbrial biogenesis protein FimT